MMNYTTKDKQFNSSKSKIGKLVGVCSFWLVLWQMLAMIVGNSLLLPNIFETVDALLILMQQGSFYIDVCWTLFRCILSIVLSFVFGIALAWLAYKNELVRSLMTLPVSFFKAVPVMAIVIYVILVVEADWVAVVACFLMCFPIAYTNVLGGLMETSLELLEVAKIYRISKWDTIKLIYVPSTMPHFNAAMKIVAGLSWKAVVAAEVLSVPEFSLGQGMISAKYYLETPTLFAYIIVIVALSLALEKLIVIVTSKLTSVDYTGSKLKVNKACNKDVFVSPEIKLGKLDKSFGQKKVLESFSNIFMAGSKTAIFGPSGNGKTTLARIIAGLEKEDSGIIETSKPLKIAYLFQEDRLLPWLNVYDNMALGMSDTGAVERIEAMAEALEIKDVLWKMPEALSGGMKHRVALGRTFLADSNLMILDEPFRGLDKELKERIVDRLWEKETADKTVMVISHNKEDIELLGIDESIYVE